MDGFNDSNPSSPGHPCALQGPQCFELSTGSPQSDSSVVETSDAPQRSEPLPISFDIDGIKKPQSTSAMTPGRKRLEGYGKMKMLSPRTDVSATPNSDAKAAKAREANAQKRERVQRAKIEREAAAEAKSRNIESKCEAAKQAKARHEQREAEKKAKRQEIWRMAAITIHGDHSLSMGNISINESRSPGCMRSGHARSPEKSASFAPPSRPNSNIKMRPPSPLSTSGFGARADLSFSLDASIRSTCSRSPERPRLTQPVAPSLHSSQRAAKPRSGSSNLSHIPSKPTMTPRGNFIQSAATQNQQGCNHPNEVVPDIKRHDSFNEGTAIFHSEVGKEEHTTFSPLSTSDDEGEVAVMTDANFATETPLETSAALVEGSLASEVEVNNVTEQTAAISGCQTLKIHVQDQDNLGIARFIMRSVFSTLSSQEVPISIEATRMISPDSHGGEAVGMTSLDSMEGNATGMTPPDSKAGADATTGMTPRDSKTSADAFHHDVWISPRSSGASMLSKEETSMASMADSRSNSRNSSLVCVVPKLQLETVQAKALADEIAELRRQRDLEDEKLQTCRRDHAAEKEQLEQCQRERVRLEEKLNRCREVVARTVAAVDTLQRQRRHLQESPIEYGDENCENMQALDRAKANALEASSNASGALAFLQSREKTTPSKENSKSMNATSEKTVEPRVRSILQDTNSVHILPMV
eukprot:gnl/MRDRNA2_/MRDRNA2_121820_c0_seq1.p1 gnl/MRDRNA2_/MRDRNA2_121820_c0~~gnl/MRDRNA2_/MRDRNA2_121820_c0_seq1.p1  ORF type:complete len:699 (-),score=137.54 gnl/MRDRNA2_/MRDRNA2_121820_c0_seq1:35-2131(-)